MKIKVDKLPTKCIDCQFCVGGMMMTPLGIQKEVDLCTIMLALIPQNPNDQPKTIEKDKSPAENGCLFYDGTETTTSSILI